MSEFQEERESVESEDIEFSAEEIAGWREKIRLRREELFRKSWKNQKPSVSLASRKKEQSFELVLGWYAESGEELIRIRERNRLDGLIERGLDVNDPANRLKK